MKYNDMVLLFQDEEARVGMTCAAGRVIVACWSEGQCVVAGDGWQRRN